MGREREKKIIDSNSVPTLPELENSKKNSKKFEKIKKHNSGIISIQNGLREAKIVKKKILDPNSVHTQPGQENTEKNSRKIQKIEKPDRPRKRDKNFSSEFRSYSTWARKLRKK